MARKRRARGGVSGVQDITAQIQQGAASLRHLRDQLQGQLDQVDAALAALGGLGVGTVYGRRSARPAVRAVPTIVRRTAKRGQRGAGWATIEAVLKKQGGSGKTPDLKDAWTQLASRTPLSVALASFVRSGRLKRKGKGRGTVFSLA